MQYRALQNYGNFKLKYFILYFIISLTLLEITPMSNICVTSIRFMSDIGATFKRVMLDIGVISTWYASDIGATANTSRELLT